MTVMRSAAVVVAACVVLAGCGGDDSILPATASRSDREQITDTWVTFLAAVRAEEYDAACQAFTDGAKAGLVLGSMMLRQRVESCAVAVEAMAASIETHDVVPLTRVTIRGRTATAMELDEEWEFERVNGRWLLSREPPTR